MKRITVTQNADGTLDIDVTDWLDLNVNTLERIHYEIYRAVYRKRAELLNAERKQAQNAVSEVETKTEAKDVDFMTELGNAIE